MRLRVEYRACGGSPGKYVSGHGAFSLDAPDGCSRVEIDRLATDEARRRAVRHTGYHNAMIDWIEVKEVPE